MLGRRVDPVPRGTGGRVCAGACATGASKSVALSVEMMPSPFDSLRSRPSTLLREPRAIVDGLRAGPFDSLRSLRAGGLFSARAVIGRNRTAAINTTRIIIGLRTNGNRASSSTARGCLIEFALQLRGGDREPLAFGFGKLRQHARHVVERHLRVGARAGHGNL